MGGSISNPGMAGKELALLHHFQGEDNRQQGMVIGWVLRELEHDLMDRAALFLHPIHQGYAVCDEELGE